MSRKRSWESLKKNIILEERKDFEKNESITHKCSKKGNLGDSCSNFENKSPDQLRFREDKSNLFESVEREDINVSETTSNRSFIELGQLQQILLHPKKIRLQNVRNHNTEPFKVIYSSNKPEGILNIDRNDPELRMFAAEVGIDIDDDDERKPNKVFRLDHLTPSYIEDPPMLNGNIIGGHYGFPSEFQLKEKYSTETFSFLSNVVKDYEVFLKEHPNENYPSVSQLMVHSDQKLSKEESEKARFYDDKYLKTLPKEENQKRLSITNSTLSLLQNCLGLDVARAISDGNKFGKKIKIDSKFIEALKFSQHIKNELEEEKHFGWYACLVDSNLIDTSFVKQVLPLENKNIRHGPPTQEEINHARKTGILNLSHRSLSEIPERIWSIDVVSEEERRGYVESFEVPIHSSLWCTFKPLISLNLSFNSLFTIFPQGSALNSLKELRLTNNLLEILPDEIVGFKNLSFLDLDTNSLKKLPPTFPELKKLQELNLKRNFIENLPEAFGNLINLRKLDLSFNKLVKLPDSFSNLSCLEIVNLSFNKLYSLPLKFNNLKNLKALDVSYNKLLNFPNMAGMTKLIVINANCNAVHQFPSFSCCRMLTELRLDGNFIKNIATKNLRDCPLIQLTMSNNKIEAIPDDLFYISTLVVIDFSNNNLICLPWNLARLKYLTVLNVDSNSISNIDRSILEAGSRILIEALREKLILNEGNDFFTEPEKNRELFKYTDLSNKKYSLSILGELLKKDVAEIKKTRCLVCKNMELVEVPSVLLQEAEKAEVFRVDLTDNNFRYVPVGLKNLKTCLTELILRENYLKTIPDFIGHMKLVYLDVSFNYLDSLPLSLGSSQLKKFIANNNCFSAVPKVIYTIQSLEYVNFEKNKITEIDADRLRNLRNLSYLNFSFNCIENLPKGLAHLSHITNLYVSNNLFKEPGSGILKKGTEAIFA